MINIKELIYDPDFCQTITVKRTTCKIVKHRPSYDETSFNVIGIITIADDKTLEMLPEADRLTGAINVFTEKELYITSRDNNKNNISDIVQFEGKNYKVSRILPDTQYGFSKAVCVRMERSEDYHFDVVEEDGKMILDNGPKEE